ncbi:cell adhesion molecule CEACAM1-like isoform X2 [Salminus brasiliensis]|uniref:cell adhesion molecule CEACAM1-like isoform X2 n=1 Tax=Salminus brasiliensis TaxID=930266 RepID=UPI003B831364
MAARALCCALTLLVFGGVCSGQELQLPSRVNGATRENVVFKPSRLPSGSYDGFTWNFKTFTIISGIGSSSLPTAPYRDRISLNMSTLALELRNLTENDSGVYTLSITRTAVTYTAETTLEVFEPVSNVTITSSPTDLIEFNSTVRLVCSASGSSLSFLWLNGSSEVTPGDRVLLTNGNSTLIVFNVSRHEGGPYTCEASNAISTHMSEPLTLTINYGPDSAFVKAAPSEPIYSSGSELTLTCSAESSPAAEYQWAVDGSELSDVGQKLVLPNIQSNDSGSYTCIAHNTKTLRYSTSEPLNITVLEKISGVRLIGPSELIIEGNSTNLTCQASGMVVSAEWTKDSQKLSPSSSVIFSPNNRSVTINPVQPKDSGEYRCTLSNPVSSGFASYTMIVNYGPDGVHVTGPSEVEVEGNLVLSCRADSVPEPVYEWQFNGTKTGVTTATFSVQQVNFTYSGNYTCITWNNVTRREASGSHMLAVKAKGTLSGQGGPLSGGAIAGIVIGILLGVAGVTGLIVYLKKRPKASSKGDRQNGVTQNGGEHELNYAEVQHVRNNQSVVNMGGPSTQTRQGTPAMGMKPTPPTEVMYSEVKK